jgi:hypothetical protein
MHFEDAEILHGQTQQHDERSEERRIAGEGTHGI